jgi:hypothetical protein
MLRKYILLEHRPNLLYIYMYKYTHMLGLCSCINMCANVLGGHCKILINLISLYEYIYVNMYDACVCARASVLFARKMKRGKIVHVLQLPSSINMGVQIQYTCTLIYDFELSSSIHTISLYRCT